MDLRERSTEHLLVHCAGTPKRHARVGHAIVERSDLASRRLHTVDEWTDPQGCSTDAQRRHVQRPVGTARNETEAEERHGIDGARVVRWAEGSHLLSVRGLLPVLARASRTPPRPEILPLALPLITASIRNSNESAIIPAGPQAGRTATLWWLMLGVSTIV